MRHNERWQTILAGSERQQRFMDRLTASAVVDYRAAGGEIFCGTGCSSCCTLAVDCTAGEAFLVARGLTAVQQEAVRAYIERLKEKVAGVTALTGYLRTHRRELGGCPFLVDGCCSVYAVRPLACRALLATRESRWCGVDFSEVAAEEKRAFLDSLDRTVTAFPMHYLAATQNAGRELELQADMLMLQECGFSLYGSLPVQVFLFAEFVLADAIGKGADAVMECAAAAGLDSPFLLRIEKL